MVEYNGFDRNKSGIGSKLVKKLSENLKKSQKPEKIV